MLTIDQIKDKFQGAGLKDLDYQDVYGFMAFLREIGAVTAENPPKSGKKGKPAKIYTLAPNAAELVTGALAQISAWTTELQRQALERAKADLDAKLASLAAPAVETPAVAESTETV
jgi:hypothetical protein